MSLAAEVPPRPNISPNLHPSQHTAASSLISSPDLSSLSGSPPPPLNGDLANNHVPVPAPADVKPTSKPAKDPAAPKRPRKKRDPDSKPAVNIVNPHLGKAKKPRARRGTGARAMKKKAEEEARRLAASMQAPPIATQPAPIPPPNPPALYTPTSERGNHEAIHTSHPSHTSSPSHLQQPPTPLPRPSSGQNYDPIRSSTITTRPSSPANTISTPQKPAPLLSATRSPSITSLIDPPDAVRSYTAYQPSLKREMDQKPASPTEAKRPRLSSPQPALMDTVPVSGPVLTLERPMSLPHHEAAKPVGLTAALIPAASPHQSTPTLSKKPTPAASRGASPRPTSPKPTTKAVAPPLPTKGSGLLTGSIFGAAGNLEESTPGDLPQTVVLDIILTSEHQYVNFARLAEEKYGFDALHPRLAAQRERLARVAAAGAALEKVQKNGGSGVSADDMSEDLSNDEGDNSNVEMGGLLGSKSGEEADKPTKKKRVMKEDKYDLDDEFIDDTEQAWEEHAAASVDGFFVYSGPLNVAETEEPKAERSTSSAAPKRGRGGGRGSRGGGVGRGGRAASGASKENKDGTEVKRRVRRSKEQIERDKRELEEKKAQKEKLAILASKPSTTTTTTAPTLPSQQTGQLQFQTHYQMHT